MCEFSGVEQWSVVDYVCVVLCVVLVCTDLRVSTKDKAIRAFSYWGVHLHFRFLSQGAFTFRGNMIDMPLLLQARNILQLAAVTK